MPSQLQTSSLADNNGLPFTASNFTNNAQAVPSNSTSDVEDAVRLSLHLNQSDASRSRLSVQSTSTTSTSPQLKRKLAHLHIRNQIHALKTSTTPILNPSAGDHSFSGAQGDTSPSRLTRVNLSRSNTAPSPKRPPASHSSYGIETKSGPPPSFDTQRTRSQERAWKGDRSKSLRISSITTNAAELSSIDKKDNTDSTKQSLTTSEQASSNDTAVLRLSDNEETAAVRAPKELGQDFVQTEMESKTSDESQKSEDVFLNFARVDAALDTSSRGEKRKSRISLPYFSSGVRPATSYESSTSQRESEAFTTPRAESKTHHRQRASIGTPIGEPYLQPSSGMLGTPQPESEQSGNGVYSKRSSTLYADTIRPMQRSNLSLRNNRLISESGQSERPKYGERNATESTISTTAPSTVWDELDDLKSRIRKLELTGKLPHSSAAAMSSVERPRTATTAATTMSASPKHNKVTTPLQSTMEGIPSTIHPLLHDALANAKSVVGHEIYQKLQATAQDALQLAAMTSFDDNNVRGAFFTAADRQLRRRTESMCRNLTELAIALASESTSAQQNYRPGSRDFHLSPNVGLRSRRHSQDNETADRLVYPSARVHSRLDTRRASTQIGNAQLSHVSLEREAPAYSTQQQVGQSRISRTSGTFRHRRTQKFLDGADDEEESTSSPAVRPVSRAMTDIAGVRQIRDHAGFSREYTSQHPLPTQTVAVTRERSPLSSSFGTNFISRRKFSSPIYAAAVESSPLAPKQSWNRASILHQDKNEDTASEAPSSSRSITTRRSLGFASRLGSTVGSRLRASKPERADSRSTKTMPEGGTSEQTDMS